MQWSDNIWLPVVLSTALLISCVSMVMAYACLSRLRRQTDLTARLYKQLEHNLKLLSSSTIGMGKKIVAIENGSAASEPQSKPQNEVEKAYVKTPYSKVQPTAQDNNMSDAIMLLLAGLEPEEVARRCGISRAEASLLKLMHTRADSASAA